MRECYQSHGFSPVALQDKVLIARHRHKSGVQPRLLASTLDHGVMKQSRHDGECTGLEDRCPAEESEQRIFFMIS